MKQQDKAELFRKLHLDPEILVLPNTSDVGTSRLVEEADFPAVATSSAGIAWILGYADGEKISREEMLSMVRRIADAVQVPVTADLESGYGRDPEDVAETVRRAVAAGAVGMNLEDARGGQLLDFELAVERVRVARESAGATGVDLVINARTDGYLRVGNGPEVFAESVRRANAYGEAGADCLFVPGVRDDETIAALVREIDGPINILAGGNCPPLPRLEELGVGRVSIGGLFSLASATLVRRALDELKGSGNYGFAQDIILHGEMNALFD
ncbi:MAG: isocitrate lyase/phosphoenolpyruvate mutase family protein [bacterium]|nr:isocitrate lyase/phosphoenolpyruvate mutase family protein [bacterium]